MKQTFGDILVAIVYQGGEGNRNGFFSRSRKGLVSAKKKMRNREESKRNQGMPIANTVKSHFGEQRFHRDSNGISEAGLGEAV